MPAQFWKCDPCSVRWYGVDPECWACGHKGKPTNSVYTPPEVAPS